MISLAVFCTSCRKDENNSIEGSWYPESFTGTDGIKHEMSECEKKGTDTFSSGKYTGIVYYTNDNGECVEEGRTQSTYTIDGDKITIHIQNVKSSTSEFSVSGNTLTIINEAGTRILKRK